jgi:hypothetical protein
MRRFATLLSLCLLGALLSAGAASAHARNLVLDQGIVQSVSPSQVVLRALDGSTISVTIGQRTRVFLNGAPAPLSAIQPGYVAAALHDGSRPASFLKAVGRMPVVRDKGIIVAVSSSSISLRTPGGVVTVPVGPSTSVMLNGSPASINDLQPGYPAEVAHRGTDPALEIRARGPRR